MLAITLRRLIRSSVHLAIGPTLSRSTANGKLPSSFTIPEVVLSVYSAARTAGFVREPLKSAPIDTDAKPTLTATAEPVNDPNEFYTL